MFTWRTKSHIIFNKRSFQSNAFSIVLKIPENLPFLKLLWYSLYRMMLISHLAFCLTSELFWNRFQFWILFNLERRKVSLDALKFNEWGELWTDGMLCLNLEFHMESTVWANALLWCNIHKSDCHFSAFFLFVKLHVYTIKNTRIKCLIHCLISHFHHKHKFFFPQLMMKIDDGGWFMFSGSSVLFFNQANHSDTLVWL